LPPTLDYGGEPQINGKDQWHAVDHKWPTIKIGRGHTGNNQKVKPRTGYQINLRSGAKGKTIFTSIERTFLKS
jgi:hypothetical protein